MGVRVRVSFFPFPFFYLFQFLVFWSNRKVILVSTDLAHNLFLSLPADIDIGRILRYLHKCRHYSRDYSDTRQHLWRSKNENVILYIHQYIMLFRKNNMIYVALLAIKKWPYLVHKRFPSILLYTYNQMCRFQTCKWHY